MSTAEPSRFTTTTTTSRLPPCRRSVSPNRTPPTKVSLLQGRLLSKAHSDLVAPTHSSLKSPFVVQKVLMGNALRSSKSSTTSTTTTTTNKLNSNNNSKRSSTKGSTPPPQQQVPITTSQIKVSVLRTSPATKIKEILTATTTTSSSSARSSTKKSSGNKLDKSYSTKVTSSPPQTQSSPHPSKPPRKVKEGGGSSSSNKGNKKGSKNGGSTKRTTIVLPPSSPPPPPLMLNSSGVGQLPPRSISPKGPIRSSSPIKESSQVQESPRYTVKQRPLAPPADSRPKQQPHHYRSLPTLIPYLAETRRVTDSHFLRTSAPRPTKTSLMRHIIARDPSTTPLAFRVSTFRSTPSEATLTGHLSPSSEFGVLPRQKRRRSVSCLNLRDYSQYVLALRHSHTRSPRFARLHSLYSSLDRLCELEACSSVLPPLLPLAKKNDFDAWWKVRHRHRMEQEMDTLSRELYQAQNSREFFFRPKTPPIWAPDSHLRFKRWRVEELKAFLTGPDRSSAALWKLDLYKTHWRGVSVKEQALNLEVSDLFKKERLPSGHPAGPLPLRRAFSMSSTLSQEQREGIKKRIGTLITAAAKKKEDGVESGRQSRLGGRAAVTTRMGFTLSSDPRRVTTPQTSPDPGLSETRKKEISHQISAEVKERRKKGGDPLYSPSILPISTKIALRKAESFSGNGTTTTTTSRRLPIYSLYLRSPVNARIKAFEQQELLEERPDPTVYRSSSVVKKARIIPITVQQGPTSLPPIPFRSASPPLRSPSPPRRTTTPTPQAPPLPSEYVSHMNIISKLAALLLRRNTQLKALVTREVMERDRLERLRALNCGEVERLRDYFESDRGSGWDQLIGTNLDQPINLLRVLFCSDSNLARLAEKAVGGGGGASLGTEPRHPPDGSSPTPRPNPSSSNIFSKDQLHLNTRCRKPIYQPSSSPNVCQPTLTAHCYLNHGESLERLVGDWDEDHHQQQQHHSLPIRTLSYTNYDASLHQPRFRYVPPPPIILPKRSASAMSRLGRRVVVDHASGHRHGQQYQQQQPTRLRRAMIRVLHYPAQETAV